MSAQLGRENVHDLAPEEVARGLAEGKILLVDVREPNETEVERYPEAFYLPMSVFDPAAIPDPAGRQVVFACRSGNRSVTASLMAQAAGPALRQPSRRRHQGLEGARPADRDLADAFHLLPVPSHCEDSLSMRRPIRLTLIAAALVTAAITPAAAQPKKRADRQRLQLVGLYRPDGHRGFHASRPASRSATTPSTPTTRWRPSCSPASPATTWWCRPAISSSARSRPASSRSSTSRKLPNLANMWPEIAQRLGELRSRQPVRRQLHVGHDRHRLQRQEGARGARRRWQDRQLGHRLQAGECWRSSRIAACTCSIPPTTSCRRRCTISASIPTARRRPTCRRPPIS